MAKKEKEKTYSAILKVNDKEYKSQGETLLECLENLKPVFPIKTKGLLLVKKGELSGERVFTVWQVKHLIKIPIFRQIWAKKFEILLR